MKANDDARSLGKGMLAMAWVVVLGLLALFFHQWLERREYPNRSLEAGNAGEVRLVQNRGGHYVAPGWINGQTVRFLLDTGATEVSVPLGVARRLGLDAGPARRVRTANGEIIVYATVLDRVRLGGIALDRVRAHVNPHDRGDTVLLGMSFLRRLELIQKGGQLILRSASQP